MDALFQQVLGWLFTEAGAVAVILFLWAARSEYERRAVLKQWDEDRKLWAAKSREGWDAHNALVATTLKEIAVTNAETIATQKDVANAINLLSAKIGPR